LAYTVPAYRRVLDHAGLGDLADRIMACAGEGKRREARELIDEGCLDRLGVIVGDDLAAGLERWRPVAEQITLSVPWFGTGDAEQLTQAERLIDQIADLR